MSSIGFHFNSLYSTLQSKLLSSCNKLNSTIKSLSSNEKKIIFGGVAVLAGLYLTNSISNSISDKKKKNTTKENLSSLSPVKSHNSKEVNVGQSFGRFAGDQTKVKKENNSQLTNKSPSNKNSPNKKIEETRNSIKPIHTSKIKEKCHTSSYSGNGDEVSTPDFENSKDYNNNNNNFGYKGRKDEKGWKKKKTFSTDIEYEKNESKHKKHLKSLVKESHGQDKLFFKIYADLMCTGDDEAE